jgi:anthranilate/para-aminobenzoate synthase component I
MVLLIDNYDSFTYNLYQQVSNLGSRVKVVKNDAISLDEIERLAPDRIIISAGPGRPESSGISRQIIKHFYKTVPILGVCLGQQCFQPRAGQSAQSIIDDLENFAAENQAQDRLIVGYLSYDFGCELLDVRLKIEDDLKLPLVMALAFDNWQTYKAPAGQATPDISMRPVSSRQWYREAFKKTKAHIQAGDVYQINLAHRLEGDTNLSGLDLFKALSDGSGAGFQAYLRGPDFEILSYSPERFIKIDSDNITTSPIKGTRPRGSTPAADETMRNELLNSVKEKAELDMITDLMRNDLGQVCAVGSVQVAEKRHLTAYPRLWHANSTITGRLKPDMSAIRALASLMPGGSISGCPKKRALEVIDEVEAKRRSIFTGSLFVLNDDQLDSSILIRTLVKKAGTLYASVANGIVYDSAEDAEYQELLDKAASFLGSN